VQAQNRTLCDVKDVQTPTPEPPILNLQPRPLEANMPADDGTGSPAPGTIVLKDNVAGAMPGGLGAVAEGTFVVISDDNLTDQTKGHFNGRIYRLSARRPDLDSINAGQVWECTPGAEFRPEVVRTPGTDLEFGTSDDVNVTVNQLIGATVLVVGRGFADPLVMPTTPDGFEGAVQDIAAYVTFVKVKAN
jgi:hypothetical protein